jgi:putative heme iron utilization protein
MPDPVAAADDVARTLARDLLQADHAALAYTDAITGTPGISRISFGRAVDGTPMTLISWLAPHHAGLIAHPECAVMVGDPGPKGDPLTHPRLMLRVRARMVQRDDPSHPALRDHWLKLRPKAKLYIDFADFAFVCLTPLSAMLNGGFGRAYHLLPADLGL